MSSQRETDSERPEEEVSLLSHEDRLGKTTLNEAEQYDESHPLTSENIDDGSEGVALVSGVGSSMYREITRGHPKGLPVVCVDMGEMPG